MRKYLQAFGMVIIYKYMYSSVQCLKPGKTLRPGDHLDPKSQMNLQKDF